MDRQNLPALRGWYMYRPAAKARMRRWIGWSRKGLAKITRDAAFFLCVNGLQRGRSSHVYHVLNI